MKKLILSLFIMGAVQMVCSQTQVLDIEYLYQIDGAFYDEVQQVERDSQGNVYISGMFSGTHDFDFGSGVAELTSSVRSPFVAKYTAQGAYVWAKIFPSSSTNGSTSIKIDNSGNVYFLGYAQGSVDLNPGGTETLVSMPGLYSFLVKYSAAGVYITGTTVPLASDITLNGNNVYIVGQFGETYDFDLGPGDASITAPGSPSGYVLALDAAALNYVDVKLIGGTDIHPKQIGFDSNSNMIVSGYYTGDMLIEQSSGDITISSNGGSDAFIVYYTLAGDATTAYSIGGAGFDVLHGMHIGANNAVYLSGQYEGTVDFNPGSGVNESLSLGGADGFLLKLNADKTYAWVYSVGGAASWNDNITGIDTDEAGNVFVCGRAVASNVELNPNGVSSTLPGFNLAFISKINSNGILVSAYNIGNGNQSIFPLTIKVIPNSGNLLVGGQVTDGSVFLNHSGNITINAADVQDGFFVNYRLQDLVNLHELTKPAMVLYPNPTKSIIYFETEHLGYVQIISNDGKVLLEMNSNNYGAVDMSPFSSGIYFLTLTDINGQVIQRTKIVKE